MKPTKSMVEGAGAMGMTFACLLLTSCQSNSVDTIAVEANDLGITEVRIERSAANGDELMSLHGLDATGAEIAAGTLLTGHVLFKSESSPDIATPIDHGTELTLTVAGQTWSDVAPMQGTYQIYEPRIPAIASFVRIHAVADAIEQDAGLSFRRLLPPAKERGYALADCNGVTGLFRTDQSDPLSCCINFSGSTVTDTVFRTTGSNLVGRSFGPACTNPDNSACSGRGCYYGPCGAHINASNDWGSSTVVFWPDGYDNCGYDTSKSAGGYSWPYDWDGNGEFGDIHASCSCNDCASAGNPTPSSCYHY